MATARVELIEPTPIKDDFIQGIDHIEDMGDCARFVLFSNQVVYEAGNQTVRVVVRKIILPYEAIMPCIQKTLAFMGEKAVVTASNVIWLPKR